MSTQGEPKEARKHELDHESEDRVQKQQKTFQLSDSNENIPESNLARATKGKVFSFYIGKAGEYFTIHADLLEAASQALGAMAKLPMQESACGSSVIDDIEPKTFGFFVEWLYTRIYNTEAHSSSPLLPLKDRSREPSANVYCTFCGQSNILDYTPNFWSQSFRCTQKCYTASWDPNDKSLVWAFCGICGKDECDCDQFIDQEKGYIRILKKGPEPTADELWGHIWNHAKLYIFSDRYIIVDLKAACLQVLDAQIFKCDVHSEATPKHLVRLLSYVYENTPKSPRSLPSDEKSNTTFGIRETILAFVTMNFKNLLKNKTFAEMMMGGTEIARDIMDEFARSEN